jgi:hypothetical protein
MIGREISTVSSAAAPSSTGKNPNPPPVSRSAAAQASCRDQNGIARVLVVSFPGGGRLSIEFTGDGPSVAISACRESPAGRA